MAEVVVIRRYARALFGTALRAGTVDQVEADLKTVNEVLASAPKLARVFRAPTVAPARKKALLQKAFTGRVEDLTLRFLALTVDRRREEILSGIYGEYLRLANEWRKVLPVEVTAAVPLTDAECDALAAALSRRTGKTIQLSVGVDAELMGGLILRMGDTIVDGSVRTRLEQLRARLLGGTPV